MVPEDLIALLLGEQLPACVDIGPLFRSGRVNFSQHIAQYAGPDVKSSCITLNPLCHSSHAVVGPGPCRRATHAYLASRCVEGEVGNRYLIVALYVAGGVIDPARITTVRRAVIKDERT